MIDPVAITEGIGLGATLIGFLVGLGMTWQKSKSRAEESRALILAEETARKEAVNAEEAGRKEAILAEAKEREKETARIERLVEINSKAARAMVSEAEARGLERFNNWSISRKAVDEAQAAASLSQSTLLQTLMANVGKLEGMMVMMISRGPTPPHGCPLETADSKTAV